MQTGESFELTWDGEECKLCYIVTMVTGLNIHPDFPEVFPAPARSAASAGVDSENVNGPNFSKSESDQASFTSK